MSEGSLNQLLDDCVSAAMPAQKCPLEPSSFLGSLRSKGLRFLEEIEVHISASNCRHLPLKDLALHGSLDGTTPLLLACYLGDLECVKHIVENWRVDFQAARVYYHGFLPNRSSFESASPLFVAAFNGHIDIVKYLVRLGVDVSSKTSPEIEREKGVKRPFPYTQLLSKQWEKRDQESNPSGTFRYRSRDRLTPLHGAIHALLAESEKRKKIEGHFSGGSRERTFGKSPETSAGKNHLPLILNQNHKSIFKSLTLSDLNQVI